MYQFDKPETVASMADSSESAIAERAADRAAIERDLAAFLKAGGKVTRVPHGASGIDALSGESIKSGKHQAILSAGNREAKAVRERSIVAYIREHPGCERGEVTAHGIASRSVTLKSIRALIDAGRIRPSTLNPKRLFTA